MNETIAWYIVFFCALVNLKIGFDFYIKYSKFKLMVGEILTI